MFFPVDKVSLTFFLLGLGVFSLVYGLKGEIDTGGTIEIMASYPSDKPRLKARVFWIISGLCEIALGLWMARDLIDFQA